MSPPTPSMAQSLAPLLHGRRQPAWHRRANAGAIIPAMEIPKTLLDEYRVETQNTPASYQSGGAGVISLATKSGGDQFHGDGFVVLRPDILAANDTSISRVKSRRARPINPLIFIATRKVAPSAALSSIRSSSSTAITRPRSKNSLTAPTPLPFLPPLSSREISPPIPASQYSIRSPPIPMARAIRYKHKQWSRLAQLPPPTAFPALISTPPRNVLYLISPSPRSRLTTRSTIPNISIISTFRVSIPPLRKSSTSASIMQKARNSAYWPLFLRSTLHGRRQRLQQSLGSELRTEHHQWS